MSRQNFSSESKWESAIGYSRAVRVGNSIHVSGTTATDINGEVTQPTDAGAQAARCFEKIETVLTQAGSSLADVVRTRMYLADIRDWEVIGQVHHKVFADIRPAATMVEVSRFISAEILVEIETDAIIQETPV